MKGSVIDAETSKAVPYANVELLKSKIDRNAENEEVQSPKKGILD